MIIVLRRQIRVSKMAEFLAPVQVGNDILDIGSRKARRQRGAVAPSAAMMMGTPSQFDVPNVSNVCNFGNQITSFVAFSIRCYL